MKFKLQFRPKKRRGLSSVVGGLFFVMLLGSALTILGESVESEKSLITTTKQMADTGLKKQQEEFNVIISTDESHVLDVTVSNTGKNAVEIFTTIITNLTNATAGYPTSVYDVPYEISLIGPEHMANVLSAENMTMVLNNTYDIKVISSLGTIKKGTLVCDDVKCGFSEIATLEVDMFLESTLAIPTKNVTAVMTVTNTGNVDLTDVTPAFPDPIIEWPPTSSMIGPTFDSTSPVSLKPSQSVIFKWDLTVNGKPGDVWNFTNSAIGMDPALSPISSQNVTEQLILINPNTCGGCEGIGEDERLIEVNDLLIKPSIFMTVPSPLGESPHKALWGITVLNPTIEPIEISRVVISALSPGSQDKDVMFGTSGPAHCNPDSVGSVNYPAQSEDWDCTQQNVLFWHNFDNPVTVDQYSAESFLVKARAGNSGGSNGEPNSILVAGTIFSEMGSFGKDDYQTIIIGGTVGNPGNIANVFLSTEINGVDDGELEGMRLDIPSGSTETFHIVLADFDEDTFHAIGIGTNFIINVPPDWTNVTLLSCDGFDAGGPCDEPTVEVHPDGSTQIIGITNELIGDVHNAVDARTISFNATAPIVNSKSVSVMYALANGVTEPPDSPIGPLSEIVLQVIP